MVMWKTHKQCKQLAQSGRILKDQYYSFLLSYTGLQAIPFQNQSWIALLNVHFALKNHSENGTLKLYLLMIPGPNVQLSS